MLGLELPAPAGGADVLVNASGLHLAFIAATLCLLHSTTGTGTGTATGSGMGTGTASKPVAGSWTWCLFTLAIEQLHLPFALFVICSSALSKPANSNRTVRHGCSVMAISRACVPPKIQLNKALQQALKTRMQYA